MIVANICLTDIPESKKSQAKNGKYYVSIILDERREGADAWGNTHSAYISQSKEERERKEPKKYVGNGKELKWGGASSKSSSSSEGSVSGSRRPAQDDSDIPF